jgi:hypothetical protein
LHLVQACYRMALDLWIGYRPFHVICAQYQRLRRVAKGQEAKQSKRHGDKDLEGSSPATLSKNPGQSPFYPKFKEEKGELAVTLPQAFQRVFEPVRTAHQYALAGLQTKHTCSSLISDMVLWTVQSNQTELDDRVQTCVWEQSKGAGKAL